MQALFLLATAIGIGLVVTTTFGGSLYLLRLRLWKNTTAAKGGMLAICALFFLIAAISSVIFTAFKMIDNGEKYVKHKHQLVTTRHWLTPYADYRGNRYWREGLNEGIYLAAVVDGAIDELPVDSYGDLVKKTTDDATSTPYVDIIDDKGVKLLEPVPYWAFAPSEDLVTYHFHKPPGMKW